MISHTTAAPPAAADDILTGGGEMGRLMRTIDWSRTPLGPTSDWPQSLRTALSICLNSEFPILLWWGPELAMLYNDAYRRILGSRKHPGALGQRGRECWPEIWDIIGPMLHGVLSTGRPTWSEDQMLPLERHGYVEETYFTFSYSPIPDGVSGIRGIGGVFSAVSETTFRVLAERRHKLLRELAERTMRATSVEELCATLLPVLEGASRDIPFAQLYRVDEGGERARRVAAVGFRDGQLSGPEEQRLDDDGPTTWPFAKVVATGALQLVPDLPARWGPMPGGNWPEPARSAVVLPIGAAGSHKPKMLLVTGVSPRRSFDADYRSFLQLLANQVGAAVSNAEAHEVEKRRSEMLADLDRAKTAFFSNVSHEFRTPLTLLLGPMEDAMVRPDLPDEVRDKLEVAHRNSIRLLRLVNTLLDISRVEAGRVQAWYEPTDLAAFTRDLVSTFGSAIERGGLQLSVDLPSLEEPVWVDRDMWEKVVLNLISNAFKFTLEGEVAVRMFADGTHAVLRVRDSGIGIPEQELPRIFDRFHRVRGARGRSYEGTGIGLALVQELVKLHGGTISAESVLGRGATFTVRIPFGNAHLPADRVNTGALAHRGSGISQQYVEEALQWLPVTSGEHAAVHPPGDDHGLGTPPAARLHSTAGARILIADDNSDMRAYVQGLLAPDYEVIAVPDGKAALEAARSMQPDLILSDVMMPQMDGLELLTTIRNDAALSGVPVILLSARAGEEASTEGLALGADDYLVKPFSARELLARVDAHVRLHRLRREALRREQDLRSETEDILASLDDAFLAVDDQWRITYVNGAAERLSGIPRQRLLGADLWGIGLPIDSPDIAQALRRAMRDRVPVRFDQKLATQQRDLEIRVHPVRTGGLAAYAHDVTEQRQAQSATRFLAEINEHFARLSSADDIMRTVAVRIRDHLRVARVCFVEVDEEEGEANVIFDHHDPEVRSVLGRHRLADHLTPANLEDLRSGRPVASDDVCADPRFAPQAAVYRRYRVRSQIHAPYRRNGRWKFLLTVQQSKPRAWREDEVELLRDLSARIWPRLERARAEDALRDADRRKDDFIATLAHELRNPLTPLQHGLEVLRLAGGASPTADRVQEMMERQVDVMRRLVDDLLEVSRITRGRIELRRSHVDLTTIIRGAVETSHPLIAGSAHEFIVSLPHEPLTLDADTVRLAQVFANLLNNAARYTNPGGQIWLTARREGNEVVVSVRDSGIGIPQEMLPHIFEMFTQVDRAPNRTRGGLGIGLALVRGLVEMHGGRVEAHSEGPGRGTEFVVHLPLVADEETNEIAPAEERPRLPARVRVLVVDDNHDAADSLATLLHLTGADVRIAYDGPSALHILQKFDATAVLLDIGMPGMDGYEVARKIRERAAWRDLMLIALTGWGQEQDRQRSHAAGFSHHLVKPVDINVLQALFTPAERG